MAPMIASAVRRQSSPGRSTPSRLAASSAHTAAWCAARPRRPAVHDRGGGVAAGGQHASPKAPQQRLHVAGACRVRAVRKRQAHRAPARQSHRSPARQGHQRAGEGEGPFSGGTASALSAAPRNAPRSGAARCVAEGVLHRQRRSRSGPRRSSFRRRAVQQHLCRAVRTRWPRPPRPSARACTPRRAAAKKVGVACRTASMNARVLRHVLAAHLIPLEDLSVPAPASATAFDSRRRWRPARGSRRPACSHEVMRAGRRHAVRHDAAQAAEQFGQPTGHLRLARARAE